jgi:hypothetical protein
VIGAVLSRNYWPALLAIEGGKDGVEVFETGVLDDDAAFAVFVLDVNLEAESAL